LRRLSAFLSSSAFRTVFLLLALLAAGWAVAKNWTEVRQALQALPLWLNGVEVVLAFVYVFLTMVSWRFVLNDVGSRIPPHVARRIFFSSQVAKYLPGGVWNFVAAAEIGRDYEISRRRSISALVVSIVISIVTGMILALIAVVLSPSQKLSDLAWLGVAIPIGVVVLMPPVLNRLVNMALRILKREPLEDEMSWSGTFWAAFWAFMGWLVVGFQLWLMLINLGMTVSVSTFLLSVGGYALSWTAGFLVFFVPAGVGVREVTLGAILSSLVNSGSVVVVVLLIRVFTTIADIGLGVSASIAMRRCVGPKDSSEPSHR
jgi:uncharacterized membrane protein YbhN (UPF0104 family)